jgi:hypothetical protein
MTLTPGQQGRHLADPTLSLEGVVGPRIQPPHAYFGVPFQSDFLRRFILKTRTYGLLDGMSKPSIDPMTGNAITAAAYAICSTMPEDAPLWPVERVRDGQCLIHIEAAVLDRLWAMRRPGESYSEVILKLVELGG